MDVFSSAFGIHERALGVRSQRMEVLARNIANADTPNYKAQDIRFREALEQVSGAGNGRVGAGAPTLAGQDARHLRTASSAGGVAERTRVDYTVQTQPSLDGNSVDMDQQRANFTDNAIRYESTLRFITGHVKTMLSAIQGQ